MFIISVDRVVCRINKPRTDPGKKWYSKKLNKPGLLYELGVAIWSNRLVWINGPFLPGEDTDLTVFRKPGGLKEHIPAGKKAIADRLYSCEREKISTRNPFDAEDVKKFKSRVSARHETFNARLKNIGILNQAFRHGRGGKAVAKHKTVFEAICVITQYDLENGQPLFDA